MKIAKIAIGFVAYSTLTAICAQSTMALGNQLAVELQKILRK